MIPACQDCQHSDSIIGSCHTRCNHPDRFEEMLAMHLGVPKQVRKMKVEGDAHGVRRGWFNWPVDFDPVWLRSCSGFVPVEKGSLK